MPMNSISRSQKGQCGENERDELGARKCKEQVAILGHNFCAFPEVEPYCCDTHARVCAEGETKHNPD